MLFVVISKWMNIFFSNLMFIKAFCMKITFIFLQRGAIFYYVLLQYRHFVIQVSNEQSV